MMKASSVDPSGKTGDLGQVGLVSQMVLPENSPPPGRFPSIDAEYHAANMARHRPTRPAGFVVIGKPPGASARCFGKCGLSKETAALREPFGTRANFAKAECLWDDDARMGPRRRPLLGAMSPRQHSH
jgi:hypothetical protein